MRLLAFVIVLVQTFTHLAQTGEATPVVQAGHLPQHPGRQNQQVGKMRRELQGHHPFGGHHDHGGHHQKLDCASACNFRCSKASKSKPCHKYCNLCCQKCNCVPPGTYGNKEVCPCYNNMRNDRGGPKCP